MNGDRRAAKVVRLILLFVVLVLICGDALAQRKTPRIPCAGCGGSTGGAYSDPHGTTICQNCVGTDPVWNERTGTWVPGPGGMKGGVAIGGGGRSGGGGSGPAACSNACHNKGGRSRRAVDERAMVRFGEQVMVSAHIGNELALMIEGSKPLAVFAQEAGMSREDAVPPGFDDAVGDGRMGAMTTEIHVPGHFNHYFSLPDEAWRLVVMRAYDEEGSIVPGGGILSLNRLEHQAFLGLMLGYGRMDTGSFVKRTALRMHGSGQLSALDMAPYLDVATGKSRPAVRIGAAADADAVEGRIVLRTGQSLLLSVHPAEQWRAKVAASALDGVATWTDDRAARDVVAKLLDWVVEPEGDEVSVLMRWAERGF